MFLVLRDRASVDLIPVLNVKMCSKSAKIIICVLLFGARIFLDSFESSALALFLFEIQLNISNRPKSN